MNIDLIEEGTPPGLNVLVVAYYFPPMGLSGVQRTMKFVKYLPDFGWRPIVLTAGNTPYYANDESLLDELTPLIDTNYIRIVRTSESGIPGGKIKSQRSREGASLELPSAWYQRFRSKLLQVVYQPDSRISWKKHALESAEKILAEERIDAILSTAPPYTDFLVAREISKRHNIPYLMDYRDSWVSNKALNFYATPFHKVYAQKLESECLRGSSFITVINRRMKESLLKDYAFLKHEDVTILPHGFDAEDFIAASEFARELRRPEKFRMMYGGAFYVGYPGRSPIPFFEAVKKAMELEPRLQEDLELVIAGIIHKDYSRAIEKLGLQPSIMNLGYLPHREEVAWLLASDVLWMIAGDPFSTPGKLYEYLGTHKPILGLVPPGNAAEKLLKDYGAGTTVSPKDIPAIRDRILDLYKAWRKTQLPRAVNLPFVRSFDRKELTRELAKSLASMLRT